VAIVVTGDRWVWSDAPSVRKQIQRCKDNGEEIVIGTEGSLGIVCVDKRSGNEGEIPDLRDVIVPRG
jgi:hypothetical protein